MLSLARASRTARSGCVQCRARGVRRAHAAAFAERDEAGDASSSRDPGPSSTGTSPRKRINDYRFPEKGKNGGPPDPYEVLGITRAAGAGEIKASYYKLALILHPDSSHPSASADHFATLNRAYKLLSSTAARTSYLQTGYGWSGTAADYAESSMDAAMRATARQARARGAASWEAGRAARRGFRESDGNSGAWFYHRHPGEDFPFHDAPPTGGGQPVYMENHRFVMLIAMLAGIGAVVQWTRAGNSAETQKTLLMDRHIGASQALAEARREAAMFGKERRDMIRRRVRESAVMEEIDRMERGDPSENSHAAAQAARLAAPPSARAREAEAH